MTTKTAADIMAKKKQAGRPKRTIKKVSVVNLKSVPEWKVWLDEYAEYRGLSLADTIGMALAESAELKGFTAPPKR